MSARDPHWWHINRVQVNVIKMWLMQTRWFLISCKGLCTQFMWLDQEFQFTATTVMSMATRSSDLEDQTSETNLQTEGHTDVPSQSWKGPEETGALGSSPSHSPSWSLVRRLPPSHPNTRYCLWIHVTLIEETGMVPPLSHAWTAPLVEDMLHYARTGLTKDMVMGPGRAVLFMGDVLWERTWVQVSWGILHLCLQGWALGMKPAHLAADPLTIQEGQWEIA